MQVTCKFCQRVQEYDPGDPAPKRYRKVCEGCGRRFTIKASQAGTPGKAQPASDPGKKWASKLQGKDPRLNYLDDTDKAILEHLGRGESQPMIARAMGGITRQGVWWRIQHLKEIGVLVEHPTYPRSYTILPELASASEYVILNHDVHIRLNILATNDKYEDFKIMINGTWMANWWHRYFDYNHVHFEMNETKSPNICFHVTGCGRTAEGVEQNVMKKALEARDWLEDHVGVTLGDPIINRKQQDDVILCLNEEQYQAKCRVWNDRSDGDALLEGKLGNQNAEKAVQILNNQGVIKTEIDSIKAEIENVKNTRMVDGATELQAALQAFESRMDALDKRLDSIDSRFLRIETSLTRFADTFERIAG